MLAKDSFLFIFIGALVFVTSRFMGTWWQYDAALISLYIAIFIYFKYIAGSK